MNQLTFEDYRRSKQRGLDAVHAFEQPKIMAISLWQPWASLVAIGAKTYETRSWSTRYQGPLVIHAGRRFDAQQRQLCGRWPFNEALFGDDGPGYRSPSDLPLGAALCVVDLIDVVSTGTMDLDTLGEYELAFGDFSPGRFAWKLHNGRVFDEPVPSRGFQRLWQWGTTLRY